MTHQDQSEQRLIGELRQRIAELEKRSQQKEAEAVAVLNMAPLGIHECDTEGRITFVNPSQEAITGYTADELLGTYIWDRIEPGPERDSLSANLKHLVVEQPPPTPFFAKNIRKNGEVFDVRIDWNYKRNQQGQVTGFICIVSDITGRKRAEAALRESEERYRLLAESIPHPVWRSDAEGRQIDCNHRWQEYTGQTPEEAQGDGWMKALHPDDVAWAVQRKREDVAGGEIYQAEYRLRRASDGSYHWYLARAIPWRDANGTILGWFGCAMDIEEQKRAQEALAEREARLLEAQEVASLGFYVLDVATGVWTSSSVLDLIFGIPVDYPRTVEGWDDLVHPDERQAMLDYFRKEVVGERKPFQREYRIVRHGDRQVRWVHGLGRLEFNEEGQPVSMLGTIQDITERKLAEEALQKAHDELERRVEERTAKLAEASQQLRREIEERKAAEGTLRKSEERYKTLVDTSPDAVIMADLTGHVSFVSRRLVELHGAESADEFLGKCALDYLVPEDHGRYRQYLQKTLEDGITSDVEYTFIKKDGTRYPTELSAALVKDAAGKPVAIINVLRDITERKQAEKALRQSERRFRNYFEQGLIGMAVTSVDKRWLEVNDRLCEILGYSREELVQASWAELTHPDDLEPNVRLFNPLLAGEIDRFTLNKRYIKKDGNIVHTTIHTRAFRKDDGTADHIVTLVEDITARKQAEENLRASEERYELAVRGAGVGIWDYDVRTGKVYFSPRWKTIFGYDENDIGDSLDDWSRLLHPDERDWILKFQDDFLAGTSPTVTVEYRLRHKDGSYRWIVAHGLVLRDEQGKAYRFVGSHGDITDRKQAEEALERERQSLWRMLQASDHERRTISYEIHDGLAQYLAAANMQLQVFDGLRESNPKEAKKAYDAATQLVSQAHSESRRLISEVRHPVIDESGLETAISHLVHEQRRHGGPKIECRSSVRFGRLPVIMENALYRIVQEALTNACKHSKSEKVTVSMTQEGQDVRLEVRDWGIGFDQEAIGKGHFGLEGIRQRVRLLDGRLTIESKPGSGTLVQVVVPILEKQLEG